MDTCMHCGTRFLRTRTTRKYCTNRCRTNACLERRPRRIRAADVEALQALLDEDVATVSALRERLRAIVAPQRPPFGVIDEGTFVVPRLD